MKKKSVPHSFRFGIGSVSEKYGGKDFSRNMSGCLKARSSENLRRYEDFERFLLLKLR